MDPEREREAFLAALKEDRYDRTTHLVFADWLEDHGMDDEALVQRTWTRERQEAEDWLRAFGDRHGISYEDVVGAGHSASRDGIAEWDYDAYVQQDSESARDDMYGGGREKFWRHWQTLTGVSMSEEKRERTPFSCSC